MSPCSWVAGLYLRQKDTGVNVLVGVTEVNRERLGLENCGPGISRALKCHLRLAQREEKQTEQECPPGLQPGLF